VTTPHTATLNSFGALREWLAHHGVSPDNQAHGEFFYTLPWFDNLARHGLYTVDSSAPQQLLLLAHVCSQGDGICLPLTHGRQLTGLANYYSSLFGPMVWTNAPLVPPREEFRQAITATLRSNRSRWPVIHLSPWDAESPWYTALQTALQQAGYRVDSYFCFGNWYLPVVWPSFTAYYATLPSALRHSIERGQRRLGKQGDWSLQIHQTPGDALDAAIAHFVQVYNASWKNPEPHPDFIPGLARMAATHGWLRLGILSIQGAPVAAQIWLVKGSKASIYKLAYAKGFERFSVGSVLTHALMQHALDVDQVHEVDYLTGDDAYKRDWMTHRRERRGIVGFNLRTFSGLGGALRHWAGKCINAARGT
jgi:hypothetical protein